MINKKKKLTPREKALFPIGDKGYVRDQEFLLINLDQDLYEWLQGFVEQNCHSFFSDIEETIVTALRSMKKGDLNLSFLAGLVSEQTGSGLLEMLPEMVHVPHNAFHTGIKVNRAAEKAGKAKGWKLAKEKRNFYIKRDDKEKAEFWDQVYCFLKLLDWWEKDDSVFLI